MAVWAGRAPRPRGPCGAGRPRAPLLLMAGWAPLLPPALLLSLLCARPCPCGTAPASSSQPVTARLAAKWPATPLLLEARCVQPPPLLSPSPGAALSRLSPGEQEGGGTPPFPSAERETGLAAFLSVGGCVKILCGCEAERLSHLGKCCGQCWQGFEGAVQAASYLTCSGVLQVAGLRGCNGPITQSLPSIE